MAKVISSPADVDSLPIVHNQQFVINEKIYTILKSPRYTGDLSKMCPVIIEDLKINSAEENAGMFAYDGYGFFPPIDTSQEKDPFIIWTQKKSNNEKKVNIFFFMRHIQDFDRYINSLLAPGFKYTRSQAIQPDQSSWLSLPYLAWHKVRQWFRYYLQ